MQNTHCIEPLYSLIALAALNFSGHYAEVFDPILKVVSAGLAGMPDGDGDGNEPKSHTHRTGQRLEVTVN